MSETERTELTTGTESLGTEVMVGRMSVVDRERVGEELRGQCSRSKFLDREENQELSAMVGELLPAENFEAGTSALFEGLSPGGRERVAFAAGVFLEQSGL